MAASSLSDIWYYWSSMVGAQIIRLFSSYVVLYTMASHMTPGVNAQVAHVRYSVYTKCFYHVRCSQLRTMNLL